MSPHLFVLQSSVTHTYLGAPCVALNIYMGPFCGSLERQVKEKLPFCHFIPAFKPPPIPLPSHPHTPLSLLNQNVSGLLP